MMGHLSLVQTTPTGAEPGALGGGAAQAPGEVPGGTCLVTRTFSSIFGTRDAELPHRETFDQLPPAPEIDPWPVVEGLFCDWLSIHQLHEHPLPLIDAGAVWASDSDGVVQWRVSKPLRLEGSHATGVNIRCDGHRVELSGNISRFGREDNLFGLDLAGCLRKANELLLQLGLPPFTRGQRMLRPAGPGGLVTEEWTGAAFTRLDLTKNFACGSAESAHHYMRWLATQSVQRTKAKVHGSGETVSFGEGSRRQYWKAYLKALELVAHSSKHGGPTEAVQRLIDFCNENGVVRFEGTLKSRALRDLGCRYLGSLHMGTLYQLFAEKSSVLSRAECAGDPFAKLPRAIRATARDWAAGDDVAGTMSKTTFYRHRAALLPYGIDIAGRSSVIPLVQPVRVITLQPLRVPDWYSIEAA